MWLGKALGFGGSGEKEISWPLPSASVSQEGPSLESWKHRMKNAKGNTVSRLSSAPIQLSFDPPCLTLHKVTSSALYLKDLTGPVFSPVKLKRRKLDAQLKSALPNAWQNTNGSQKHNEGWRFQLQSNVEACQGVDSSQLYMLIREWILIFFFFNHFCLHWKQSKITHTPRHSTGKELRVTVQEIQKPVKS